MRVAVILGRGSRGESIIARRSTRQHTTAANAIMRFVVTTEAIEGAVIWILRASSQAMEPKCYR